MRIIGIDPGTNVAGYGVIDVGGSNLKPVAYGAVKTKPGTPLPERLRIIFDGLVTVIKDTKPDEAAVEKIFAGKSIESAIRTGEGRGVAILAATSTGLPVAEYAATLVKKSVVGTGGAHKSQVQEMVKILLGLPEIPRPADAADALAIALCHSHRRMNGQ
jgi:crossover junction endodeoxyribonuclease RuvC